MKKLAPLAEIFPHVHEAGGWMESERKNRRKADTFFLCLLPQLGHALRMLLGDLIPPLGMLHLFGILLDIHL